MWIIIAIKLIAVAIYIFLVRPLKFWEERKVPFVKPMPLLGNMWQVAFRKRSNAELLQELYNAFPERRYMGIFAFTTPTLLVRDLDLIKKIMVKDFDSFPDHRPFVNAEIDPIWSKNLFAMKGDERWHEMRSTLSPSYTSSKMKGIFLLIKECSKQFVDHYSKYDEMVTIEFKDAFSRFANDVIATSAFGIKCDSLKEPNNEFYLMGKEVVATFSGANLLILMVNMFLPILSKTLRIPLFSKKLVNFFASIIKDTIKQREEKHIVRPDMLHLLIEARKGKLQHKKELSIPEAGFAVVEESEVITNSNKRKLSISEEDITAQGFIFFFAGFESISTMMSYTAYELALNPDIQKKLQEEVDETLKRSANDFTYETLMHMKYLDCVVSETLRKWPSFVGTNRLCVKPYTIPAEKPDESALTLEKGMSCFIPIAAIHRDAKYYPNPDKYDPERFNDENRKNIRPFSYLPFGGGPRNCIGSRFALLEAKLLIAEIVSKFEFVVVEKTQIPIKFSRKNFSPVPDEGFWLGLRKRKN